VGGVNADVAAPPEPVIRAFGASGPPSRLTGGQETTWRVGDTVLKPVGGIEAELEWQASIMTRIVDGGVRVAPPLRSRTGALVVDGWSASPWLEGRWKVAIRAGGPKSSTPANDFTLH
jgi:hypothetical protein